MFRNEYAPKGEHLDMENLDETLRMSSSTAGSVSVDSSRPTPDIHPYLEIGKCLQDLRRSVFDMYKEEVSKSSTVYEEENEEVSRDDHASYYSSSTVEGSSRQQEQYKHHQSYEAEDGTAHDLEERKESGGSQLGSPVGVKREEDRTASPIRASSASSAADTTIGRDDHDDHDDHDDPNVLSGPNASAVQVSHSIALIVGQHEEKFASLSKNIDYWRQRSEALASQLDQTDKSHNSKLEFVIQEQEALSEQQQKVLLELSEALANQQQLAAQLTAASAGTSAGAGTNSDFGQVDGSTPPPPAATPNASANAGVIAPSPFTPEQVKYGEEMMRKSLEKLDTLIHLTQNNASFLSSVTPKKGPPPQQSGGEGESPTTPGSSSSQLQLLAVQQQETHNKQAELDHMQKLYDNLSQQLRKLFAEKSQLMQELSELRGVNLGLQQQIRDEADGFQTHLRETKANFDTELRAAHVMAQEAKDQTAQAKASEKRFQENEKDLQLRIGDLDAQLTSRVLEVTTVRSSLAKAQHRVNQLQEELTSMTLAYEQSDAELQDQKRKYKEVTRTIHSKDEMNRNLQMELNELHAKLKKPFTTSAKQIEKSEQRINYDYEISMLKDSVLAIQESEAELQKEYLNLQTESKRELKRMKDAHAAELTQLSEESEAEIDRLRRELNQRGRHLEQQTRLRNVAEDDLAELRVQYVKLEESISHFKVESNELQHVRDQSFLEIDDMKEKLSTKQTEITKILAELQRARKRTEKLEMAHDEKDKLMSEMRHRQQRLQQSIRSHAEKEIDHLQALKHAMQAASTRLSASDQAQQALRLKNKSASSPGTPQTPPPSNTSTTTTARGGGAGRAGGSPGDPLLNSPPASSASSSMLSANAAAVGSPGPSPAGSAAGSLPISVKGRKLPLSALEAECDALWEDIPTAVEGVLNELKQFHSRAVNLSSDLNIARSNSTAMNSELTAHISKQQQEILSLRHEIDTRDIQAKKRLEKQREAAESEFSKHIERLKGEITTMSRQIDETATEKAQQTHSLRSEIDSVQSEADSFQQQLHELRRQYAALDDAKQLSDKRCRMAAVEFLREVYALPSVVYQAEGGDRGSVSPKVIAAVEKDHVTPPEQLLSTVLSHMKERSKDLGAFLKTRKRSDNHQQDAMKTFLDSLNASFISVNQSHRAHILQEQLAKLEKAEEDSNFPSSSTTAATASATASPTKNSSSLKRQDLSHLYPYLCADDVELPDMFTKLEENIYRSLSRSHEIETYLIHSKQEMLSLQEQLQETRESMGTLQAQKENLQKKVSNLETHLQEQISEIGRSNESMHEKERQMIRDRELLEAETSEIEEKLQVAVQRNDNFEQAIAQLEEDLSITQTDLTGTRSTLDEVFAQLQASQGKLGDMQQDLQATTVERDELRVRMEKSSQAIAELQEAHEAYAEQVQELKQVVADSKATNFQLETEKGKAEALATELDKELHALQQELEETKGKLQDVNAKLEQKLVQIVDSESRISQLCGEVESQSFSLTQEEQQLRQTREQLTFTSTSLASLQIEHNELQRVHGDSESELQSTHEKNALLEGLVDEADTLIKTLRSQVKDLQVEIATKDAAFKEVESSKDEIQQQLNDYHSFDDDYRELQGVLTNRQNEIIELEQQLSDSQTREKQLQEEQEVLSEKLVLLAEEAAKWPLREEELETQIAVQQGQLQAFTTQLAEADESIAAYKVKELELVETTANLDASRETVEKLESQLQDAEARESGVKEELLALQGGHQQLLEKFEQMTKDRDQQVELLKESNSVIKTHELSLTGASQQDMVARSTINALTRDKEGLQERLDDVCATLTATQIELADKSANLKVHLEWKLQVQDEKAQLQDQLTASQESTQRLEQQVGKLSRSEEELTKENNYLKTNSTKLEQTCTSQRSTIRDLRDSVEELESGMGELTEQCRTLPEVLERNQTLEDEAEDYRKALLREAAEKEALAKELEAQGTQLKHSSFSLVNTRRELESAERTLDSKAALEIELRDTRGELDGASKERDEAQRDLHARVLQVDRLEQDLAAKQSQLDKLSSELAETRGELKSTTEKLYSTKGNFDVASSQLTSAREEAANAKQRLEDISKEYTAKSVAVEHTSKSKSDLESKVMILETTNAELSRTAQQLELSKQELFERSTEAARAEREKSEARIEGLQQRTNQLTQELETARRELTSTRRVGDEAALKLNMAERSADALRTKVDQLQQDNNMLRLDLGLSSRERKSIEAENTELSSHKAEADSLRASILEMQRQMQEESTSRMLSDNRELAAKNLELQSLRREVEDLQSALQDSMRYKKQFDEQEEQRAGVMKDLTELKIENERLQSRIKTTQMDMELSQRQFSFSNLMMAGASGVRAGNPFEPMGREEKLTTAMEKISNLLQEKDAASAQQANAQQALEVHTLQLAEVKHANVLLQDQNSKLEDKLERLREKMEANAVERSALEQKNHSLQSELTTVQTQLQHRVLEVERLNAGKEQQESRTADALQTMQEKWMASQGELQKESLLRQSVQTELDDLKRTRAARESQAEQEVNSLRHAYDASKQEVADLQESLMQVKSEFVSDKERFMSLSRQQHELTGELAENERTISQLREEVATHRTTVAELNSKLSATTKQSNEWEQQYHQQCKQVELVTEQITQSLDMIHPPPTPAGGKGRGHDDDGDDDDAVVDDGGMMKGSSPPKSPSSGKPLTLEHLAFNLTNEIAKYHTVYTDMHSSKNRNKDLESRLSQYGRQDGEQKIAIHRLSSELEITTQKHDECKLQLETLQSSYAENEATLKSLKSINTELEFMCDTMAKELKAAMQRVEELDASTAEQKAQWLKEIEDVRAEAEQRIHREVGPMKNQVSDVSERLQAASMTSHNLQTDAMKSKAEALRAQQDLDSVAASVRALYNQVMSTGIPMTTGTSGGGGAASTTTPGLGGNPPQTVPEVYKITSVTALVNSLQSTFSSWIHTVNDLRANHACQAEVIEVKNKHIDELQGRMQQYASETQECFQSLHTELDTLTRESVPDSANSPTKFAPHSPARNKSFMSGSSPSRGMMNSPPVFTTVSNDPSSPSSIAPLYQRIVRTIASVRAQYEEKVNALSAECEALRVKLSQQRSNLVARGASGGAYSNSRDADNVSVTSQQSSNAQQQLSRSLKERTTLQNKVDKLKVELKKRTAEMNEIQQRSDAATSKWNATEQRYLTQIQQLQSSGFGGRDRTPNSAAATATGGRGAGGTPSLNQDDAALLQELIQYKEMTEMKILDFEHLLRTTFYHDTAASKHSGAAAGTSSGHPRTPEQLELEQAIAEDEEGMLDLRAGDNYFAPTSPVANTRKAAEQTRLWATTTSRGSGIGSSSNSSSSSSSDALARYHAMKGGGGPLGAAAASTTPTGTLVKAGAGGAIAGAGIANTASDMLLSGMLMDFHKVLKEHRRLKRLCSSQQMCIMALRLLQRESEAALDESKIP